MRLNCAIFDMDGTVLDSTQAWVQAAACVLTRRGKTPPEDFSAVIRPMDAEQLVTYFRREYLPEITLRPVSYTHLCASDGNFGRMKGILWGFCRKKFTIPSFFSRSHMVY